MFSTEAELSAYLLKRETALYGRLLLRRVFQGAVSAVLGSVPSQQIQVIKTGESASDGVSYPVVSGWDPAIGDLVDIVWRDNDAGLAAFPVSAGALGRLPARHPYRCKVYLSINANVLPGYTLVNYDSVEYDPSGMKRAGDIQIPVDGVYITVVHNRVIGFVETTSALWWRPVGGASNLISRGIYGTGLNDSELVDIRFFRANDRLNGYVYVAVGNTIVGTDPPTAAAVFMEVCLLSRG